MSRAIDLGLIYRPSGAREINISRVSELSESMREIGLLSPICVKPAKHYRGASQIDAYDIIAGNHRYEAALKLKWAEIDCIVLELDDLHAELAEIDENLIRCPLTPAQEASAIFRRKQIYEALHPETVNGATGGGHNQLRQFGEAAERFTASTAAATGKAERNIQRAAARGEALGDDLAVVVGTSLDKGVELDALAKMPESERAPLIERAKAGEKVSARTDYEASELRREMERRNNDVNRVVEMTDAQRFAEWIMAKTDLSEIDVVISWLQGTKSKDVISALRREVA